MHNPWVRNHLDSRPCDGTGGSWSVRRCSASGRRRRACTDQPTVGNPGHRGRRPGRAGRPAGEDPDHRPGSGRAGRAERRRRRLPGGAVAARAIFEADEHGVVDLARRRRPRARTPWSTPWACSGRWIRSPGRPTRAATFRRTPSGRAAYPVTLTATGSRGARASQELGRQWTSAGVTHRTLDLATDGVAGDLVSAGADGGRRPAACCSSVGPAAAPGPSSRPPCWPRAATRRWR